MPVPEGQYLDHKSFIASNIQRSTLYTISSPLADWATTSLALAMNYSSDTRGLDRPSATTVSDCWSDLFFATVFDGGSEDLSPDALILVNTEHIKAVSGRKTDVRDCE